MRLGRMQLWLAIGSGLTVAATTVGVVAFVRNNDEPAVRVQQVASSGAVSAGAARGVEAYWTAERMAKARPVGAPADPGEVAATGGAARTAKAYSGIPSVGALFFNNGAGDHYCTAAVVNSRSKRLIITAAHCIHGGKGRGYFKNIAFVPRYDRGKKPYGIWTARKMFVPKGWAKRSDPDLDFGFVSLHTKDGRRIQPAVGGGNKMAVNKGYVNIVNVTGYPSVRRDPRDRPIWCRTKTAKHSRFQIKMACNGFYGGVSGSPWLLNYNTKTHKGTINGVLGGYRRGGNVHWISYAAYFDKDVLKLRAYANDHA
ncbi:MULTISPECIES: trypsin-like serine peptidase [Thermomonospora]|nr:MULTISPECIES: trypsin-like serine protease [Thermomonospora]